MKSIIKGEKVKKNIIWVVTKEAVALSVGGNLVNKKL